MGLTADRSAILVVVDRSQVTPTLHGHLPLTPAATPLPPVDQLTDAYTVPLSWTALVQTLHALPGALLSDEAGAWWQAQDQARGVTFPLQQALPDGLTPYPWQAAGAARFALTGRALLSDDPGVGKTITAVLAVAERQLLLGDALPVVVLAPASTIAAWVSAFRTWAPHLTAVDWRGDRRLRHLGHADVYVTSYETAAVGKWSSTDKARRRWRWGPASDRLRETVTGGTLIADEHHLVKTPSARRTLAAHRLASAAAHRIAMSGTPIAAHPGDFWGGLACVEPDAYPSHTRYVDRYCETVLDGERDKIIGLREGMRGELDETLRGTHRRVSKAEALPFLPEKVYSERLVTLPAAWRKTYDDLEKTMLADLPEDGGELSVMSVLAQMTFLARLACAPGDVEVRHEWDERLEMEVPRYSLHMRAPSWKVAALVELLAEREGQQTVVFCVSRQLADLAAAACEAEGLRVERIVGGQPAKARQDGIDRFQAGQADVMVATISAGGVGVTLTAATAAVFLERSWSVIESIQAEDRCHRIGSEVHDSVDIIDVVAADTIDQRVRAALKGKAGQLADLLKDPAIAANLLGGDRRPAPTKKGSAA